MPASPLEGLSILVLDDEALWREHVAASLERLGMDVTGVGTLAAARQMAGEFHFDFALLDVTLPDGTGTDLLRERVFAPATGLIIMTGNTDVRTAVGAMRLGAADYLVKPFDAAELPLVITRVRKSKQSARVEEHRREGDDLFFGAALAPLHAQLEFILAADRREQTGLSPVLIAGEAGTGRTFIARWLHRHGPRSAQPLVEVGGGALTGPFAAQELFGQERGATPGGGAARMGLFEAAHGGTLFLEELACLPAALQPGVQKAIEDGRIRRVGGTKDIPVDVRVIAATDRDLAAEAGAGRFREDLLRRFELFRVVLMPLRERGGDIIALAEHLITRMCRRHRLPVRAVTPAGRERLAAHRWPGNVRELAHELERAIVFGDPGALDFSELATKGRTVEVATAAVPPGAAPVDAWMNPAFHLKGDGNFHLEEAINRFILLALRQTKGNVTAAARLLGVTRDYVRYRLEDKGLASAVKQATAGASCDESPANAAK